MYEDNNYTYKIGLNWKDILIKVVMLILFIILLLWLFPRPNLDVFYDSVYNNNINSMREAARNYYTTDKLPNNVGEQTSMTLKEMFDNHLLIRFTDKDGAVCDESSSKVELSKISDEEYALKVQLNCGDQKDYILETIGCTSVCKNGNCQTVIVDNNNNSNGNTNNNNNGTIAEGGGNTAADTEIDDSIPDKGEALVNKITYYQHKKAITTTKKIYTCPSGYTKKGTKCTKKTTGATIDATPVYNPDQTITVDAKIVTEGNREYVDAVKTKVRTDYSCPTGYTLNGSYCIKYTDATEHQGETSYTCPSGYTKNGTKCTKTYTATYVAGSTNYTCPSGGTLSGTKCTITQKATASTTYTCPSGYTKNGTSCYKVYNATSTTTYSCPSGYTKSGSNCTKTYNATSKTTYSCPSGYSKSGSNCTKTYAASKSTSYGSWVAKGTQYYTSANKAYTGTTAKLVYAGAVSGAVCGSPCGNSGIWYKYTYYTRSTNTSYSCPNGGTRSGTNCVITKNATASTSYSCPDGGTRSGSKCTISKNATASTSYSCPNGGTRSGSKCTLTANATAKTTYSCPSGYTLNGSSCVKTYDATKNTGSGSYTCPSGGTLSGTTCTITQDATSTPGGKTYTCPTGYTLNGTKCEYKISATPTDIYSYTCPTGYTAEGTGENTKCYKIATTTKYYCEDSTATLNGTKCTKVVKGNVKYYTCPTGYSVSGDKCVKNSTITIDATVTKKKSTSYQYKWSKNSYLEGWTFTGKTKVVTEKYTAGQK